MNLDCGKALHLLPFDHRRSNLEDRFDVNRSLWTTDKDSIAAALRLAEITAPTGREPGAHDAALAQEFGSPVAGGGACKAAAEVQLAALTPQQMILTELTGETLESVFSRAPGNGESIGGIKVNTASGWFAARPSGTEDIYKIDAESFAGPERLQRIQLEAQAVVGAAISPAPAS